MHIPERYRDRYDRLALSHPWMREMRDADDMPEDELIRELRHYADDVRYDYNPLDDAFEPDERLSELCGQVADMLKAKLGEPTNVIDGETNGIADGPPLVDGLPEGDAVEILRKWANFWGVSHSTYTQCDSNWEVTTMRTLADMVERDYVRRDDYDFIADALKYMKAERDALQEKLDDDRKYVRLKKQVDSLTVRAVGAEQEADELTAIVDRLTVERDNLAADLKSCEGQLKTERNNFRQATGARDYWRDKLSMVLDRLRELGCEVGSINDVPITVELPDGDVKAENEKLKAEIIQYVKDCGECGTAMPKGVSWPRFDNGSLVQFGDSVEVAGGVFAVERVEFTEHRFRLFTDKVGCFVDSPIGWMVEKPKGHEEDEGQA